MEDEELVAVCFREECLRCCRGQWFVSTVWISNWKDMTPKDYDRWSQYMFRKCLVDYRISIIEIRNETITYHTWQNVSLTEIEPVDYQLDEIPSWCKPLVF